MRTIRSGGDEPVAEPYRGPDRRGVVTANAALQIRPFVATGAALLVLAALSIAMGVGEGIGATVDTRALASELRAALAAVACLGGALLVLRWRLVADAPSLWIGAALLTYGVGAMALAGIVLPASGLAGGPTSAWARPAGVTVALLLLLVALVSPDIDARLSARRVVLGAFAGTLALTGMLATAATFVSAFAPDAIGVGAVPTLPSLTGDLLIATALAGLGVTFAWRGLRSRRVLFAWQGLALLGLAAGETTRAVAEAVPVPAGWELGSTMLRLAALAVAFAGASSEVRGAWLSQSAQLHASELRVRHEAARARAVEAAQAERAHEARNALQAIEGATLTLDQHRQGMDDAARAQLTTAVVAEIARLQRLVSDERLHRDMGPFDLREVVDAQVALTRAQGATALVEGPERLTAYGRSLDVAEILQNLLANAQRHGRGPVVVRLSVDGERSVVVRVEDHGPGVPAQQREAIFQRGVRDPSAGGLGIGLAVARRLAHDLGGDLRAEARTGGGAAFALRLPRQTGTGDASTDGVESIEEVENVVGSVHDQRLARPLGFEGGGPEASRRQA